MPKLFSESDFLILPYDFSGESIRFIQYSMPTKAPEYMMSGTPIIVFSPKEAAIVNYFKRYKCAEVVTENDHEILAASIKYLLQNKSAREVIGKNAKQIARDNYNSIKIIQKFREVICNLTTDYPIILSN